MPQDEDEQDDSSNQEAQQMPRSRMRSGRAAVSAGKPPWLFDDGLLLDHVPSSNALQLAALEAYPLVGIADSGKL
jgi:hypothetical protein